MAEPRLTQIRPDPSWPADEYVRTNATGDGFEVGLPTADDVGLGNVDNTSDADKPVSTAQQAALDLKLDIVASGTNLGGSSLDAEGNVVLNYSTVYGIDATGTAYYDPAGAAAGEEAVLVVNTDGTLSIVKVGG